MSQITSSTPSPISKRQVILVTALLVLILVLGAFLRFYHLGGSGVGNQYYAAAVKSMLQSWHNFFFVAFEPGGSISVDKPPLGFWVQCLSAYFLGVTGLALALPNAIAGVISIYLVFLLVRRPFGVWAGLLAALALALTPVAISAERNNTIDGLLVCVLLLAALAIMQSVYTRKVGWLFLGVFLVGLGFNIKMLQAFLPLPAFYAVYFFAARYKWWQKILHLAAATLLLLVVSFSWAVAVDLTAPENRPYVGGSEDNTVMELIFGHNGIARILSRGVERMRSNVPQQVPGGGLPPGGQLPPLQPGAYAPPAGLPVPGLPTQGDYQRYMIPGGAGMSTSTDGVMDVGTPGTLRLFTFPLVGEIGWVLPFVLAGIILIAWVVGVKHPLNIQQAALILWAGWLIPEAIYFSYSTGIMHAYYMIMMGAPLAGLFAMTGWAAWQIQLRRKWLGLSLVSLLVAGTITFQAFTLQGKTSAAAWLVGVAAFLLILGFLLVGFKQSREWITRVGFSLVLLSLLVAPGAWSVLTTFNTSPNGSLPYSGPSQDLHSIGASDDTFAPVLLEYLLENTDPEDYLLATVAANTAAPFILATGRAVFTFGGFGGMDQVVDAAGLAEMVSAGDLRFVLNQGLESRQEIRGWLVENCKPAILPGLPARLGPGARTQSAFPLFDCGG